MNEKEYSKYVEGRAKKSPIWKNSLLAFLVGGLICTLGQGFFHLYTFLGVEEVDARTLVSVTLIFITVVLTGFGIFDKIAKFAGAGTLVPITGFANSVTSSAMEYKSEGIVTGIINNLLKLAGSVIVTGVISAFVVSTILYFIGG